MSMTGFYSSTFENKPMIRKNKFGVVRAMLQHAKRLGLALNKRDKRVGYIIQSYEFFVWNNEEEFNVYIAQCMHRLIPARQKKIGSQYLKAS